MSSIRSPLAAACKNLSRVKPSPRLLTCYYNAIHSLILPNLASAGTDITSVISRQLPPRLPPNMEWQIDRPSEGLGLERMSGFHGQLPEAILVITVDHHNLKVCTKPNNIPKACNRCYVMILLKDLGVLLQGCTANRKSAVRHFQVVEHTNACLKVQRENPQ